MTSRTRAGLPAVPAPDAAASGAIAQGKRTLSQGLPVQRKAASPPAAEPGAAAASAAPADDPYGFHLPVQRKAGRVSAGSETENKCLTEYGDQLPNPDSPDATDRLEINDGEAAYTPSFDADGKLTSIAKRYHDKFNNMSVMVMIKVVPPRKVSEAKAKAKVDAFAKETYRQWLAERVDVISQLCAQRKPLEIEEQLDLGDGEPDVAPPGPTSATASTSIQVLFPHGKAVPLNVAGVVELARQLHQKRPDATVRLDGYASSVGPDKLNDDLSRQRVAAVRGALRAIEGLHVPPRDGEAHGEHKAKATEAGKTGAELEHEQAHNRRVDITFTD